MTIATNRQEVEITEILTEYEQERLDHCECVIRDGIDAWSATADALREIRDGRLYRKTHKSFDTYMLQVWGYGRRHADKLIKSFNAMNEMMDYEKVTPMGVNSVIRPSNERAARPLAGVPVEQRSDVMAIAAEAAEADGKPITAAHVQAAAETVTGKTRAPKAPRETEAPRRGPSDEQIDAGLNSFFRDAPLPTSSAAVVGLDAPGVPGPNRDYPSGIVNAAPVGEHGESPIWGTAVDVAIEAITDEMLRFEVLRRVDRRAPMAVQLSEIVHLLANMVMIARGARDVSDLLAPVADDIEPVAEVPEAEIVVQVAEVELDPLVSEEKIAEHMKEVGRHYPELGCCLCKKTLAPDMTGWDVPTVRTVGKNARYLGSGVLMVGRDVLDTVFYCPDCVRLADVCMRCGITKEHPEGPGEWAAPDMCQACAAAMCAPKHSRANLSLPRFVHRDSHGDAYCDFCLQSVEDSAGRITPCGCKTAVRAREEATGNREQDTHNLQAPSSGTRSEDTVAETPSSDAELEPWTDEEIAPLDPVAAEPAPANPLRMVTAVPEPEPAEDEIELPEMYEDAQGVMRCSYCRLRMTSLLKGFVPCQCAESKAARAKQGNRAGKLIDEAIPSDDDLISDPDPEMTAAHVMAKPKGMTVGCLDCGKPIDGQVWCDDCAEKRALDRGY